MPNIIQVKRLLVDGEVSFECSFPAPHGAARFAATNRDLHVALFFLLQWLAEEKDDLRDFAINAQIIDEVPRCQYPPTCNRSPMKGDFCELHACTKDGCARPRHNFFHICEEH